jgi:hypothetical protein
LPHQRRVDAFGELLGAVEVGVQFVGPRARVLQVADEAVLEVPPPNWAPTRIPTARAMKTAISEVAW